MSKRNNNKNKIEHKLYIVRAKVTGSKYAVIAWMFKPEDYSLRLLQDSMWKAHLEIVSQLKDSGHEVSDDE
jgi:hypothetical protein